MHLTKNRNEFLKWLEYWLEEKQERKLIYDNFVKYGQTEWKQWFAERNFIVDFSPKYQIDSINGIIYAKLTTPFNAVLCWPENEVKNINDNVWQICAEQLENSPHRYRKCPKDCSVLDFGCSEGVFPALYCDNSNQVVGFDSNDNFKMCYEEACDANGIKDHKFVCEFIDANWRFDESLIDKPLGAIKMDIEGNELLVLIALKDIIKKHKPMLQIACYHYDSQFKDILEYCINVLGYSNFEFNPNHMIFSLENKYVISDNFLKQGMIIAKHYGKD